jgi:hypothetical protein
LLYCEIHLLIVCFCANVLQPEDAEGKSEEEIDDMIDPTFWLDDCPYILSVKVHRSSTNWTVDCTDSGPGGKRDDVRKKEAARVAKKRAENAEERDRAVSTRADIQTRNLEVQENLAREYVLKSKKKRESATVKNLEKKISMLEKHKDIYVKKYGEDGYEAKLGKLVDELLASGAEEEINDKNDV